MNFTECMKTLHFLLRNAYIASKELTLETSQKDNYEIVTNVDIFLQDYISQQLQVLYPNIPIQGEESSTFDQNLKNYWILDPLDGTFNFANHSPLYGISLAYIENQMPKVAAIYLPSTDEFIFAHKEHGCYRNKALVQLKTSLNLPESLISFGDFSSSNPASRKLQAKLIDTLADQVYKIRINGASSIDFTNLPKGYSDAHILFSKRPWELYPGLLIAKQSGFNVKIIELEGLIMYGCFHPMISKEILSLIASQYTITSITDF